MSLNNLSFTLIMTFVSQPLILTLDLTEDRQQFFTALRRQYFPPERNYIDAHLTLFHHLSPDEPVILQSLENLAKQQPPLILNVSSIVSIGNGVAYKIESPELLKLHASLQQQWLQWLIPQDQQKLWPHITVQNKVTAIIAKETLQKLLIGFKPFGVIATGLSLWEYEGGPWKFFKKFEFSTSPL